MSTHHPSQTILILKPVGLAAQDALTSEFNTDRLLQGNAVSTDCSHQFEDSASRECTPYFPPPRATELHLRFNPLPKDPTRGFVFGSDEVKCDIVLKDNGSRGISRVHFFVDFNWVSGLARLNNLSRYGTGIHSPCIDNGDHYLRIRESRILYPSEQSRVTAGTMQFDVSFPVLNEQDMPLHQRNWRDLHTQWRQAVPNIGELGIQTTPAITQYAAIRKGAHRTYILHGQINKGSFGIVRMATDNAGNRFAAKAFERVKKPIPTINPYSEIGLCQKISHVRGLVVDRPYDPTDLRVGAHCRVLRCSRG